ncbi:hypothetical protein EX895_006452 [Sporisorium graminicola]|uniref:Uncharacterized protein n=1 Tax=Sporisorium graminicola TaxID=280036 RepID=A0A4U7KKH5_9BASI|nr:hypothetical protein EX895_006452 [Sporisorium graminicola]TKY84550.1 hypothetical protein EX895_006452 [Sporisorium graminicola]
MSSAAATRPPATTAGTASGSSTSSTSAIPGPSSSSNPSSSTKPASSSASSQPQVSLLGTLPFHLVPALLRRIESNLVTLPPTLLCEKETVLARHDDETSAVRETGDNAWASVVKARKGVKLRVVETVKRSNSGGGDSVECTLSLPLPSLPERQYPRASVRPSYTVQVLSDTTLSPGQTFDSTHNPLNTPTASTHTDPLLGFDPTTHLDTDRANGWKSFVSSIGWRPHFAFLRHGLTYPLNQTLSRHSSTATSTPINPAQGTKHTLNVYRIFTPDPTGYTDDWVPLDPEGATVVVELIATIGGQLDQSHFNPFCSAIEPGTPQMGGGLDPSSTIENAIEYAASVAKALRGLVDLRREAYD